MAGLKGISACRERAFASHNPETTVLLGTRIVQEKSAAIGPPATLRHFNSLVRGFSRRACQAKALEMTHRLSHSISIASRFVQSTVT
jgi:hypothetical protein